MITGRDSKFAIPHGPRRNALVKKNEKKKWTYFSIQCFPMSANALLLEDPQASPVRPSGKSNMQISMEWQWLGKTEKKTLFPCHILHHKTHMTCPEILPGRSRWQASV